MKAKIFFGNLLPALFLCSSAFAQQTFTGVSASHLVPKAEKVVMSDVCKSPAFITVSKSASVSAPEFNEWIRAALKMRSEDALQQYRTSSDKTDVRFQQLYNNIPVEGGEYIEHLQNGNVISANGTFYPAIKTEITSSLSEEKALQSALAHVGGKKYIWEDKKAVEHFRNAYNNPSLDYFPHGTLVIVPTNGNYAQGDFHLCWKFDIWSEEPLKREYVFVDAKTGEAVFFFSRIHTADTPGSANTLYSNTQTITCDNNGGNFTLQQAGPVTIHTWNLQNGSSQASAVDFTSNSATWNLSSTDRCAGDAHFGAEQTYAFYKNILNRNSIDDAGMPILAYVHYSSGYNNAFWDGQAMNYGDGSGSFTYFEGLDVCGHEMSHGVTQFTCGLQYSGEPGALNEGFSDCMGESIEFMAKPSQADWLMGEDITVSKGGIRSMSSPKAFQQPDCYNGTYWSLSDPHIGSGVLNYWFYLVSAGGSGKNDVGNNYSVTGIGIAKAEQILYKAWKSYMTSTSTFANCRTATEQACQNLYPSDCAAYATVQEAWYAVGVGGLPTNPVLSVNFSGSPLVTCSAPSTVNFSDLSSGATTWKWDFGDGGNSTLQNPSHTYNNPGSYTVKLVCTQTGGCGSGTDSTVKTSFVQVGVAGAPIPIVEGFESSSTLPSGWSLSSSNNDGYNWVVSPSVSGWGTGSHCMAFDNCSPSANITGRKYQFKTISYDLSNTISASMTFDVAYAYLIWNSVYYTDSLAVYYSTDCGTTWNQNYYKGGANLATAPNLTQPAPTCFTPASSQWKTETINLSSLSGQQHVMFMFENRSQWGEWIYVDNINITGVVGVPTLNSADGFIIYPNPASASFTLEGKSSAEKIHYALYTMLGEEIKSGTIVPGADEFKGKVEVNDLARGMYFLNVKDGTHSWTKKLNVQ